MLNEKLNILDVCAEFGIKLNSKNKACCPFHKEKTPSFTIKGTMFNCFGCGVKGDSIRLKSMLANVEEKDICKELVQGLSFAETIKYEKAKAQRAKVGVFMEWYDKAFINIINYRNKFRDLAANISIENVNDAWQYVAESTRADMLLNYYEIYTPKDFYTNFKVEVDKIGARLQ